MQVTAVHNEAPPYRESEETLEDEGSRREDDTEIRSLRSDGTEYESAQEEEDDEKELKEESRKDGPDPEDKERHLEKKEVIKVSLPHTDGETEVERDIPVSSANRERVLSSTSSVGGIDNPAFEGDDTLQGDKNIHSSSEGKEIKKRFFFPFPLKFCTTDVKF